MSTPHTDANFFILTRKYKSQGTGFFLTLFFGGIGLCYSSIAGGIIIFVIEFVIGLLMGVHIREVTNTYSLLNNFAGWGYAPTYDLAPYLLGLSICRIVALIISYQAVVSHNQVIDDLIVSQSELVVKKDSDEKTQTAAELDESVFDGEKSQMIEEYHSDKSERQFSWILLLIAGAFIVYILIGYIYMFHTN